LQQHILQHGQPEAHVLLGVRQNIGEAARLAAEASDDSKMIHSPGNRGRFTGTVLLSGSYFLIFFTKEELTWGQEI